VDLERLPVTLTDFDETSSADHANPDESFNGTYMDNWELLIPALLLTILPMIVVYLIAQKQIIQGVMSGSIK